MPGVEYRAPHWVPFVMIYAIERSANRPFDLLEVNQKGGVIPKSEHFIEDIQAHKSSTVVSRRHAFARLCARQVRECTRGSFWTLECLWRHWRNLLLLADGATPKPEIQNGISIEGSTMWMVWSLWKEGILYVLGIDDSMYVQQVNFKRFFLGVG